jgi:putative FmdB family regulatory protein
MPLYEYKCQSCGDVFEVRQKFSDEPLSVHEACGGPVERLISPSALQFKGSGWYVNDYGKGKSGGESKPASSNGAEKGDKGEKPSGASEAAPKTESPKPAATPTKKSDT